MDADAQFGEIAVKNKLISKKQRDEALRALKKLKKRFRGKKKKPRLVDVLVQKEYLSSSEARQVENARLYREARMNDKLYGRIALKSKFVKPKQVERGLKAQKESYLEGEGPSRLSEFLLDKNYLTEEQDEAIQEVMRKLNVQEYMAGRKGKGRRDESDEDLDDDSDVEDSAELEELGDDDDSGSDMEIELDLDEDLPAESLDEAEDLDELDSQIEDALSDLDELDLDAGGDDDDEDEDDDIPAPRGLSSDDLLDDDMDDDSGMGLDGDPDDDPDLGSSIELHSDEVPSKQSGGSGLSSDDLGDLDDDLDDLDLDDLDLD